MSTTEWCQLSVATCGVPRGRDQQGFKVFKAVLAKRGQLSLLRASSEVQTPKLQVMKGG